MAAGVDKTGIIRDAVRRFPFLEVSNYRIYNGRVM